MRFLFINSHSNFLDDNRFDLRQFLYNTKWTTQFRSIDAIVEDLESETGENDKKKYDKKID